ncbi:MAG TPA: CHAT domain-containing protein [Dongiaceae bacterium]|nr:CHAT domain-containing protein [Dongiaceae bacterium]
MDTLILHYTIEPQGNRPALGLVPIRHRNDGRLLFLQAHPRLCELDAALGVAVELRDSVRRAIEALGPRVNLRAASGFYGELQRLGAKLLNLLAPSEIVGLLQDDARIRHLTFCFDPRLNAIPFEWMWLDGDFLAFRFAVGRELLSTIAAAAPSCRRLAGLPFSGRLFLVPPAELDLAERQQICDQAADFYSDWVHSGKSSAVRFDTLDLTGRVTAAEVLEAFQTREIVSLCSHHRYDENQPENSGYALSDHATFTARQLLEGFTPGQVPPRLVFSLSCESAITRGWEQDWPRSERIYGMVDAAKRIGIPHYIGALVEIPALKTGGILNRFYAALASGHTVGEALRLARISMRQNPLDPADGGTVLGLALTLYGEPAAALLSGSGRRTAEVHAPVCEGKAEGGFCGKAVAPQDPGYALRLCPDHYLPEGCSAGHDLAAGTRLKTCTECDHKLCPQCSGWGKQLCWEHCCHEGHEVLAGAKKECRDPGNMHPDEKRSVCPLDAGWVRGLCRECLER